MLLPCLQTKTVEVSLEALQSGGHESLPPLMNPTMLEASDDLTNLSHLNEPAGKYLLYTFCVEPPCPGANTEHDADRVCCA